MSVTDPATRRARPNIQVERGRIGSRVGLHPELVALVAIAVASGVVLRFVATSPLWLDEALSVHIAQLPVGEIPEALRRDGHPPLFYFLLHGWISLFGSSDVAVRALSGLLGVACLPLAWIAGRRRGGPVLGALTLAVVAMSPFALRYATETRMYSLVMLLVLVGYLFMDDVVRGGRRSVGRVAALAGVTAALLYTHYWALWLVGAAGLSALVIAWRSTGETRAGALRATAALVVGGVAFVPWLPILAEQAAHTGTPWAEPQRPTAVLATTLTDFGGGGFRDAELVGALLLVAVLLAVFGRALDRRRIEIDLLSNPQLRVEAAVVATTLAVGAVVGYLASSAYASRYAAVLFPLFTLLVAGGLSRFADRWVLFGATAVLLVLLASGAAFNVVEQRSQARNSAVAIREVSRPGDLVVFCPDQLGPAGSRELEGAGLELLVYPTLASARFVDWFDYAQRNAAADPVALSASVTERAGDQRSVFVVWNGSYRTFEGQCEAFVDALSGTRPGMVEILPDGSGEYFEPSTTLWFPPPG